MSLLPTQSSNLSAVGEWILVRSYECPVILLAATGTSTSRPPAGRESNWNGMLGCAEYESRKRALGSWSDPGRRLEDHEDLFDNRSCPLTDAMVVAALQYAEIIRNFDAAFPS